MVYLPIIFNGNKQAIKGFTMGQDEGAIVMFDSTGVRLVDGSYKNGKRHGYWQDFYNNGKPRLAAYFKNGEYDGPYTDYFENGRVHVKTFSLVVSKKDSVWNLIL